jgi:uncharacterized protein (UPF0332 family)
MSFAWIDYLRVAEALVQARSNFAPPEARYRVAISRAYYAIHCAARNYARDHEGYVPTYTGQDHSLVPKYYLAGTIKTRQKIGRTLTRLLAMRNHVDYNDTPLPHLRKEAQFAVTEARIIFGLLQQLSP